MSRISQPGCCLQNCFTKPISWSITGSVSIILASQDYGAASCWSFCFSTLSFKVRQTKPSRPCLSLRPLSLPLPSIPTTSLPAEPSEKIYINYSLSVPWVRAELLEWQTQSRWYLVETPLSYAHCFCLYWFLGLWVSVHLHTHPELCCSVVCLGNCWIPQTACQ